MKKRLSKFLSMILIAALIVTSFVSFSEADKISAAEEIKVFVTIADDTGNQVVKQKTVEVTDVDADGTLTICDALYCAHEKYYKGGAEAGFGADVHPEFGLSLYKLWGVENGGSYGYMVNDAYAWNLADPVQNGDQVNAFCYIDAAYNDKYTFFTKRVKSVHEGKTVKLRLCTIEWDYMTGESKNVPFAGASVTVNGIASGLFTDENGYVKIPAIASGSYYVSAESSDQLIVAPACVAFVQPKKGETIEVKNIKYTVTKNGKVSTGKKGKATFSKAENPGKTAPKTMEYAGVTYKVKVVD